MLIKRVLQLWEKITITNEAFIDGGVNIMRLEKGMELRRTDKELDNHQGVGRQICSAQVAQVVQVSGD